MGKHRIIKLIFILLALILVLFIFGILIFIILRSVSYVKKFYCYHSDKAKLSKIYRELKTGDIVLYTSGVHDFSNSLLTSCLFSHVGMIIKSKSGQLFISESAIKQPFKDDTWSFPMSGSTVLPFFSRIKNYTGMIFIQQLSKELSVENEKNVRDAAIQSVGNPYPTFSEGLSSILFNKKNKSRHCFQHLAFLLKSANIIDLEDSFTGICNSLSNLSNKKLNNNYMYSEPKQLIYDI